MKKTFTLGLALLFTSSLHAESVKILTCGDGTPGREEPQLYGLGISPNGQYICGAIENGNGFFVADAATGEVKWGLADSDSGGELRNIDNSGVAVGFTDYGIKYSFTTGKQTMVEAPEGFRYVLCEDITEDGKLIVGSLSSQSFTTYAAYQKDGGEWVTLPIPTEEELGPFSDIPDGSAAKYVSNDGKVILGYLGSFTLPVVWFLNEEGEYEADFFPARYIKQTEEDIDNPSRPLYSISGMYYNMSNNGKYICLLGLIKNTEDISINVPVIFNTDTRDIKIYNEEQNIDAISMGLYPTAICDDGTFIGTIGQPYFNEFGSFIMEADETQASTYNEAFPIFEKKLGESENHGFNMPTGMSADGRIILGYTYYCEDYMDSAADAYYVTYIINRDESFVEKISDNSSSSQPEAFFSIDGKCHKSLVKGVNIIRMSDGSTRKIMVK